MTMRKAIECALVIAIFGFATAFIPVQVAQAADGDSAPPKKIISKRKSTAGSKITAPALPTPIDWNLLETPVTELREQSKLLATDKKLLRQQDFDHLEALANEAVMAKLIKAVYKEATEQKWVQTQSFRIFPLENLLSNSAMNAPVTFNTNGFRVGVFALRLGKLQRGVLLTTSFKSNAPGELRDLYRIDSLMPLIDKSEHEFKAFGAEIVERFRSGDKRRSEHIQVTGVADAWVVGCESTIAGRFCVNASLFDSNETDPSTFIEALTGAPGFNDSEKMIRAQSLAWPVERTFISRGFKGCPCRANHMGLDMTAPIGTPVHAVANGIVLHAKKYSGWGNAVVIEHTLPNGSKYISLYAHLSKFRNGLKTGDVITRGDLIAESGKTGSAAATGAKLAPHLHLEIRKVIDGQEPLRKPRNREEWPIDPLHVLDAFNIFVSPVADGR